MPTRWPRWMFKFQLAAIAVAIGFPLNAAASHEQPLFINWHGITGRPEFHVIDDRGVVTLRSDDGQATPIRLVDDVSDAVAVLADVRLVSIRHPLLAWAGSNLAALRDKAVARARSAEEAGLLASPPKGQSEQWSGDSSLASALQYSRALQRAGRINDGMEFLRQQIASSSTNFTAEYKRVFLTVRLANLMFSVGHEDAAISMLRKYINDKSIPSEYRLNIGVNLAQILARHGRYLEALHMIDTERRAFGEQSRETIDSLKVPGSYTNFAWIKACALTGLGREAEAKGLIENIEKTASETSAISIDALARNSYYRCVHDPEGLARELAKEVTDAQPGDDIFHELQPQSDYYAPDRATLAQALDQPILANTLAHRAFVLAPGVAPVTGSWQPFATVEPAGHIIP